MKNSNNNILDEAYERAIKVLQNCAHPVGMKASAKTRGYPHVWARDSMITLLGGVLTGDKKILRALKASINTLKKHQTSLGSIPNNVHVKNNKANYQAYADSGLWYILGNIFYYEMSGDIKLIKNNYRNIQKTLKWYEYLDLDLNGFINMTEGADWEDLLAVRGKGLYVNTLYYVALIKSSKIAKLLKNKKDAEYFLKRGTNLKNLINKYFWYKGDNNLLNHIKLSHGTEPFDFSEEDSLGRKRVFPKKIILKKDSYYLPCLSFRNFGEWFDSFGNLMAILSGVASKNQSKDLIKLIDKYRLAKPYPIKAIYPPITPKRKDWRYYYKFGDLNSPNQYHNGGIWPFLGGFYIGALVKEKKYTEAKKQLLELAELNKRGIKEEWEFNEWFHGKNGKPMGMAEQAWSAGMYIYAYETVKKKKTIFF